MALVKCGTRHWKWNSGVKNDEGAQHIEWNDFVKVEIRVGKVVKAEVFAEAKKPAYVLHVDFGGKIGIKKSSAQITDLYND